MAKKDYYEILGLSKSASEDEIKRAFRRLARQFHPDVNKEAGSEAKFKEINEAYHVLSDPQKRQQYDSFGHQEHGSYQGGYQDFDLGDLFSGGFGNFGGFEDIFESFFGRQPGGRGRSASELRGDDLSYDLKIPLEVAAAGQEREITLDHFVRCDNCMGSGAAPGSSPVRCNTCRGSGQVSRSQRTMLGAFTQITTCPDCKGAGEVISCPCSSCRGTGRVRKLHTVKVKIPAGIDSGYRLRVSGAGNAAPRSGRPGDLYVFITVLPHSSFKRNGPDLHYKKKITFVQASLGAEVTAPTIDGTAKINIPSGTEAGATFRLKGKGVPNLEGRGRGDEIITIDIEVPKKLSREEAELLTKFGKLRNEIK